MGAPISPSGPKPILVDRAGEMCRLRTFRPSEVDERSAKWLLDPAVAAGLNMPASIGIDAFRSYVASFDNFSRNLMAVRTLDNEAIGLVMVDIDMRHRLGSLHLIIGEKEERRLQISIEAITLAVWHLFMERKLEKLTFEPLARNRAAVAGCRFGMLRQEAELLSHRLDARSGQRLDQLIFAVTLAEFKQRLKAVSKLPVFQGPGLPRNFVRDTAASVGRPRNR
ncbi:acetyltransferase [Mesorhizobium australicum]|uniref:GNAT family N-acetyltransferase n=1 Tax=Mesorhizobium australicum TaxID=536018 RepID=UPI003336BAEF